MAFMCSSLGLADPLMDWKKMKKIKGQNYKEENLHIWKNMHFFNATGLILALAKTQLTS